MPFNTSAGGCRWLRGHNDARSNQAFTSPVFGEILATRSVIQTLAQISPSTHSGSFNCGTGRAQAFNDVAAAVINTVEGSDASADELAERGLIEYIPFPQQLVGKYQSYTQADLAVLREAGCTVEFRSVEEGVSAYTRELLGA